MWSARSSEAEWEYSTRRGVPPNGSRVMTDYAIKGQLGRISAGPKKLNSVGIP